MKYNIQRNSVGVVVFIVGIEAQKGTPIFFSKDHGVIYLHLSYFLDGFSRKVFLILDELPPFCSGHKYGRVAKNR